MKKGSSGSPVLLMKHGRRMYIPSPTERVSNHILGDRSCFRTSYWEPPKGAASFVPALISRNSPSTRRRPPPRRPAQSAATIHAACIAGTAAGSTTYPALAGACGSSSPSAASFARCSTAPPHLRRAPPGVRCAVGTDDRPARPETPSQMPTVADGLRGRHRHDEGRLAGIGRLPRWPMAAGPATDSPCAVSEP